MAAKERFGKASEAAQAARSHPYVQRLLHDQELRASLTTAYAAARSAYGRISNGKPPSKTLMEDKKLQRELKQAVEALRDASSALKAPPPPKRRRGRGAGLIVLMVVGGVLALALSESLRSKVLDLLFGSEEEFDYSASSPNESSGSTDGAAEEAPPTVPAEDQGS
jgi:hypothetical protein